MNGELLMDALGGETTFAEVSAEGVGFVPACTLGVRPSLLETQIWTKYISDPFIIGGPES